METKTAIVIGCVMEALGPEDGWTILSWLSWSMEEKALDRGDHLRPRCCIETDGFPSGDLLTVDIGGSCTL